MFIIVRHGNTFAADETPRRIGARTDLPLTADGLAQAEALGRHFAREGHRFTRVLVSPLLRTRQTAEAIMAYLPSPPTPDLCKWLREIDYGPDEDSPEDAVVARLGRAALDAWDQHASPPPDWIVDAPMRLSHWSALFTAPQGDGATLIVTSNGVARFALLADPAPVVARMRLGSLKLPTGGYGTIRYGSNGTLEVPVWGRRP